MNNNESTSDGCCSDLMELMSVRLFKALGDPNRVAILSKLVDCCAPANVSDMARCCPVDVSVVSRHLALLREAGVLVAEKKGKEVYYSIRAKELVQTLRRIADVIESCCLAGKKEASDEGP